MEKNSVFKYIAINVIRTAGTILIDQESYTNSQCPTEISRECKQNKDDILVQK